MPSASAGRLYLRQHIVTARFQHKGENPLRPPLLGRQGRNDVDLALAPDEILLRRLAQRSAEQVIWSKPGLARIRAVASEPFYSIDIPSQSVTGQVCQLTSQTSVEPPAEISPSRGSTRVASPASAGSCLYDTRARKPAHRPSTRSAPSSCDGVDERSSCRLAEDRTCQSRGRIQSRFASPSARPRRSAAPIVMALTCAQSIALIVSQNWAKSGTILGATPVFS